MADTDKLDRFETEGCSRCGGSGRYSYCQMYGSTCFKCHGAGKVYTKRGAAALALYRGSLMVPAKDMQLGDLLEIDDFFKGKRFFVRVDNIYCDLLNKGMLHISGLHKGESYGLGCFPDNPVRKGWSAEDKKAKLNAALAFQAILGKHGKPLKSKMAA